MKKRYLFPLITVGSLTGIAIFGAIIGSNNVSQCNSGDTAACDTIIKVHGSTYMSADEVTNKYYMDKLAALQKKDAEAEAAKAKAAADVVAARERADAATKKQAEEQKKAAEKAAAAFKAEGWFKLDTGIYGRWCTNTCSKASVIGNQSYWLLEVWAKDRAAGDIYARVNILENGTVVGWTNDTSYLNLGQKGVMTFAKYLPGYGANYGAQITEFNARG